MPKYLTNDQATLITDKQTEAEAFFTKYGFPLMIGMLMGPVVPDDTVLPATEIELDIPKFLAKNLSLEPLLGQDNLVHDEVTFAAVVEKILQHPLPTPIIITKPIFQ